MRLLLPASPVSAMLADGTGQGKVIIVNIGLVLPSSQERNRRCPKCWWCRPARCDGLLGFEDARLCSYADEPSMPVRSASRMRREAHCADRALAHVQGRHVFRSRLAGV